MGALDYMEVGYQNDFATAWSRHAQEIGDMMQQASLGALAASRLEACAI